MNRKELYGIFKTSFKEWLEDNAVLRAAALTFFIILPLPTLLLIVIAVFAQFYGQTQAIQILVQIISSVVGPVVADLFRQLLSNAGSPFTSVWTAIVEVGFSVGGAIGAFSVLRDAMDCIWEVKVPKKRTLRERIREKIGPFVLVSTLGLFVIAWTALASSLSSLITLYSINGVLTTLVINVAQVVLSFTVATLLLALIYKLIPQARVHWQDVKVAAVVTGVAFTVTNYIFGTYIQAFTVTTLIGAAGALLIILLWIFVLNQIVLFGAEVSKAYATNVGDHAREHLSPVLERLVQPLEKAGERIEQATKDEFETEEKSEEEVKPQKETKPNEEKPESKGSEPEKEAEQKKPEQKEEGSVEINIKLKS
jgi:membrane protein